MKTIALLRFSHRQEGNCAAIGAYIHSSFPDADILEFVMDADSCRPCHDCSYQCLRGEGSCPHLCGSYADALNTIRTSDLAFFILPNYCGFPCASYFAFNERSVGFFHGNEALLESYLAVPKRFIIVSNTESQVFTDAMQQQVLQPPEILYLKSNCYEKKGVNGDILSSDAAKSTLEAFLRKDDFL